MADIKIDTEQPNPQNPSQFTRGEKCVFIHLIITFFLVLLIVVIYFIHLLFVDHMAGEHLKLTRRSSKASHKTSAYQSIGMVYLNMSTPKIICASLLLKQQWSVVTAHCVIIRSNPELANLLPKWKIKYRTIEDEEMESDIKRGIVHSYFNNDDFNNNIGIFEHTDNIYTREIEISNVIMNIVTRQGQDDGDSENSSENSSETVFAIDYNIINKHADSMKIVNWKEYGLRAVMLVKPLSLEKCTRLVTPIVNEMRVNEFCVMKKTPRNVQLDIGSVLMIQERIVGFLSWGDRTCVSLPFVILNLYPYKNWLEYMITL